LKKKKKKPAPAPKKAKKKPAPKKPTKKPGTPKKPPKKPTPKPPKKPMAATDRTPDICAVNFSAHNGDPVYFENIPAAGVTLSQVSTDDTYPFSPVTGTVNGLDYTEVATGGYVTISVPTLDKTYPYNVSLTCDPDNPAHSVTVDS